MRKMITRAVVAWAAPRVYRAVRRQIDSRRTARTGARPSGGRY
ncbi:hypothetical protein [Vallicoccus soli]|nr:hypothetical protein [Vallicoccus soli]